jgi:hypothetical protein
MGTRRTDRPGDEQAKHAARVGSTPEAQLAWLVDFAQRPLEAATAGDLDNLARQARLVFAERDTVAATIDQLRRLQEHTRRLLAGTLAGVDLPLRNVVMALDAEAARVRLFARSLDLQAQALATVGERLLTAGHLLRACAAPALRSQEPCGRWFVQARPQQAYCSATCQSRASVRAYRDRQTTEGKT